RARPMNPDVTPVKGVPAKDVRALTLTALESADANELDLFLNQFFGDSRSLSGTREMTAWKYFEARPDWKKPRSWAYRDPQGKIVAHLGLWPVIFFLPGGPEPTWHGLDWAVAPAFKGVGRQLMTTVIGDLRLWYMVGGNARSRSLLPKVGYEKKGGVDTYFRV